jgi:NAD(P)-dependent dehydrogenase (short-subunit alcohol dehydrogenase family)
MVEGDSCNLEKKIAFITGGASGIGLGMAKSFVQAGMKVVVSDIRQDRLDEASAGFKQRGEEKSVHLLKLDVTDREAFAGAADETERVFGKVHILCSNAGVGVIGPIKLAKYGDWDFVLSVMLGGAVNAIQTFLPRILKHGKAGQNISSMGGVSPESVIY